MLRWYLIACMPRKYSPHYYTASSSLNCWHKAAQIHWIMLFTPNSEPTIWHVAAEIKIHWIFFCSVLVNLCPLWSSAAVACPLQGSMCCVLPVTSSAYLGLLPSNHNSLNDCMMYDWLSVTCHFSPPCLQPPINLDHPIMTIYTFTPAPHALPLIQIENPYMAQCSKSHTSG